MRNVPRESQSGVELDGDERGFTGIVRFVLPLVTSSGLQQAVPLIINAIISRFPDGTLALAAFGVVRGFIFLLAGPMRNLQQAGVAAAPGRRLPDHRARFADRRRGAGARARGPIGGLRRGTRP